MQALRSGSIAGSVEMLVLDVKSYESIAAAAKAVENTHGKSTAIAANS